MSVFDTIDAVLFHAQKFCKLVDVKSNRKAHRDWFEEVDSSFS